MDQQQHTRRIREKLEMAALAANQATATLADVRTAIDCAEAEGFRVTCAEAGVSVTPDQRIGTYYLSPNGEQGYLYLPRVRPDSADRPRKSVSSPALGERDALRRAELR